MIFALIVSIFFFSPEVLLKRKTKFDVFSHKSNLLQNEQQMTHQLREKQADQDLWRREVDQKMARLMNLRESLPKEVRRKIETNRIDFLRFRFTI